VKLASWGADLLNLLLPAGCIACRAWIPGGSGAPYVCARCASRLRTASWPRCERCHHPMGSGRTASENCAECADWSPALTAARHAYVMRAPADDLVHALKYEGWPELASLMGDALAKLVARDPGLAEGRALVVPVPTTAERLRSRGYNQAESLARRVAEVLDLPLCGALRRPGARRSQTTLTPTERRENVRGAFESSYAAGPVRGAKILLVDDVLTTGATASEAATELARMGACSVTVLTYGRALATGTKKPH
jgi:ComF family protein